MEIDQAWITLGVAWLAVVVWGVEDETDFAWHSGESGGDGFYEPRFERVGGCEAVEDHADFHEEPPADSLGV